MEITATAKYVRVTPRKLKILANSLVSFSPQQAVYRLTNIQKSGAVELKKLILSAIANNKNLNLVDEKLLIIKCINILSAGGMKRFRAVSRGMAHSYKKRMSHIKVVLTTGKSDDKSIKTIKIGKEVKKDSS